MKAASSKQVLAKPSKVAGRSRPEPRIGGASQSDAEQGHGEDESEGVDGAPEYGTQHPIPDQLHEEEGEADPGRGDEDEPGGRVRRKGLGGGVRFGRFDSPSASRREMWFATIARSRFKALASHSVFRVPKTSSMKNVPTKDPATAPRVLIP